MTVRFLMMMAGALMAASTAMAQPSGGAVVVAANPEDAVGDPRWDKIECRKEDISGSRVRKVKVCKTVREWEAQGRRTQEGWKRQNRHAPGIGGNGGG